METTLSALLTTFWLLMLLLSVAVIMIMTPITRHNITPIHRILALMSQGRSKGNELAQIHEGISNLMEQNENLNKKLMEALPGSRAEMVRRFLSDSFETEDD